MIFTKAESDMFVNYLNSLREDVSEILNVIINEFGSITPDYINNLIWQINQLQNDIKNKQSNFEVIKDSQTGSAKYLAPIIDIDDSHFPLLSRSILNKRKIIAQKTDEYLSKTHNEEMRIKIYEPLNQISKFMEKEWFIKTTPLKMPILSEYITTKQYEERQNTFQLNKREYDEKFNILLSPQLLYNDLRYFRKKCHDRNITIVVAYIDIDDFKSYNSKYGETKIDNLLLPRFMQLLDNHIYYHGYAYRYGGDEYFIILPNISINFAKKYFEEFQHKLKDFIFPEIDCNPTVSIGLFCVNSDCILTEREIEEKANIAKKSAKDTGKNKIVISEK